MKKSLVALMVALLGLAWYVTLSSWLGNGGKYEACLTEAKRLEEKGLYLDAIAKYEETKNLKPADREIELLIAGDYRAMGDGKTYTNKLQAVISAYGPDKEVLDLLYTYYRENDTEAGWIRCMKKLWEKYPDDKTVESYFDTVKGLYQEKYMNNIENIDIFHGKYAVFTQEGKKGLMDTEGGVVLEPLYDDIAYNGKDDDRILVRDSGSAYYVNKKGNKVLEPTENYAYLGLLSQNRAVAEKAGKYGYLDEKMQEKIPFTYDDATLFQEKMAAVKQGERWAIIDNKGKQKTEFIYDEVAINSLGGCSIGDVIWVKQKDAWLLIDNKGESVSAETYEEVRAFESEEYCAVKKDGMWGFADKQGQLMIPCTYEDAKSFMNGFAPVKKDGLWGYIDQKNYLAVAYSFDEAGQVNQDMIAPIAHQKGFTLIEFLAYR